MTTTTATDLHVERRPDGRALCGAPDGEPIWDGTTGGVSLCEACTDLRDGVDSLAAYRRRHEMDERRGIVRGRPGPANGFLG